MRSTRIILVWWSTARSGSVEAEASVTVGLAGFELRGLRDGDQEPSDAAGLQRARWDHRDALLSNTHWTPRTAYLNTMSSNVTDT